MWTMGDDFAYENANTWFKQMDKLIHYVNKVLIFQINGYHMCCGHNESTSGVSVCYESFAE